MKTTGAEERNSIALLFRNNEFDWWRDFVSLSKIALIKAYAQSSARINVKERFANWHITECLLKWELVFTIIECYGDGLSDGVTELGERICRHVQDQISKWAIGADHLSMQSLVIDRRIVNIEANELRYIKFRASLSPIVSTRQVSTCRR